MQKDKLIHFLASCGLTLIFSMLVGWELAAIFTFAIGIGKELYDSRQPDNYFDWFDLLSDGIGIITGIIIWTI